MHLDESIIIIIFFLFPSLVEMVKEKMHHIHVFINQCCLFHEKYRYVFF